MQFKSLTIALCALGLIVSVPAVKMATAQTEPATLAEKIQQWQAEESKQFKVCDRVTQAENNDNYGEVSFFNEFKGVDLTDEQRNAYDALLAQADERKSAIYENSLSIVNSVATLSFGSGDFDSIPQDVLADIEAAFEKGPKFDQQAALNQEFGEYGEFYVSYFNYTTPEQKAQLAQIVKDFDAQVQGIMTPEQLPQYQQNLASRLRLNEACDAKVPIPTDTAMGQLVDSIPELLQ